MVDYPVRWHVHSGQGYTVRRKRSLGNDSMVVVRADII